MQAGSFFSNEDMARTLRFDLAPLSMVHRPELHAGIAPSSKLASRHWITNRPHSAAVKKHLQLGPGDYSEASPFCGTPFKAVHCGTMARCTRTQELRYAVAFILLQMQTVGHQILSRNAMYAGVNG